MRSAVRHLALLLLLLPALVAARGAGVLEGTVVRVVDGDTVHVRVGSVVEKVRYIGVDAPEIHHPRRTVLAAEGERTAVAAPSSWVVR